MEKQLNSCLDGVEAAVEALTASIVAYKPSATLADSLLTADAELKSTLAELCVHQDNARRLAELRAEVEAVEAANRLQHQGLADIHAELGSAQMSAPRGLPVPVKELLNVAAATAKYAPPPGYQPPSLSSQQQQAQTQGADGINNDPALQGSDSLGAAAVASNQSPDAMSPGAMPAISAAASPEAMETDFAPGDSAGAGAISPNSSFPATQPFSDPAVAPHITKNSSDPLAQQPAANPGLLVLSQFEMNRLDPAGQAPFVPWISEAMIARSHLARMQSQGGSGDVNNISSGAERQPQPQQQREDEGARVREGSGIAAAGQIKAGDDDTENARQTTQTPQYHQQQIKQEEGDQRGQRDQSGTAEPAAAVKSEEASRPEPLSTGTTAATVSSSLPSTGDHSNLPGQQPSPQPPQSQPQQMNTSTTSVPAPAPAPAPAPITQPTPASASAEEPKAFSWGDDDDDD